MSDNIPGAPIASPSLSHMPQAPLSSQPAAEEPLVPSAEETGGTTSVVVHLERIERMLEEQRRDILELKRALIHRTSTLH